MFFLHDTPSKIKHGKMPFWIKYKRDRVDACVRYDKGNSRSLFKIYPH